MQLATKAEFNGSRALRVIASRPSARRFKARRPLGWADRMIAELEIRESGYFAVEVAVDRRIEKGGN
jgi:hypothetical protein